MNALELVNNNELSQKELDIENEICQLYKEKSLDELRDLLTNNEKKAFKLFVEQGAYMITAKSKLEHGQFTPWLQEVFGELYSTRHCNNAMRMAIAAFPYRDQLDDAGMSKNKFSLLMKIENNVLQKALQEGEIDGTPLEKITNKDIQHILAKQEASEKLKDKEIIELKEENTELKESIEEGTEQLESLREENEDLKTPSRKKAEQLREADEAIAEINYQIELLKGFKLEKEESEPRLSQLTLTLHALEKLWKSKK